MFRVGLVFNHSRVYVNAFRCVLDTIQGFTEMVGRHNGAPHDPFNEQLPRDARAVDAQVSQLRSLLKAHQCERCIQTVYGVGY